MFGKKFLFASLAMVVAVVPLNADSVTYTEEGEKKIAKGDVMTENNNKVVIKAEDGTETSLKSDQVISINREGFAEPLLLALRESLLALKDSSKLATAASGLSKISTNKNFKDWEREYALRYKFDMYYSLGMIDKAKDALDELAGQFPESRVIIEYRQKLAYFAISYGNNAVAFSQKVPLNDELGGGLGSYIGIYIDSLNKIKKGDYKDAQRSLKNLLQSQLPRLEVNGRKPTKPARQLKVHVIGKYAYCMAKQGNIDGAKGQLKALKELLGKTNDRSHALYAMASAEIAFQEKKFRKAYYAYLKVAIQYPGEIDIQVDSYLNAIEAAKAAKGLEEDAKKLEDKFKRLHPKHK